MLRAQVRSLYGVSESTTAGRARRAPASDLTRRSWSAARARVGARYRAVPPSAMAVSAGSEIADGLAGRGPGRDDHVPAGVGVPGRGGLVRPRRGDPGPAQRPWPARAAPSPGHTPSSPGPRRHPLDVRQPPGPRPLGQNPPDRLARFGPVSGRLRRRFRRVSPAGRIRRAGRGLPGPGHGWMAAVVRESGRVLAGGKGGDHRHRVSVCHRQAGCLEP